METCKEIRLCRKGSHPSWLSLFHLLAWGQGHFHGPRFIHLNRGSVILGTTGSIASEQTCLVPTWWQSLQISSHVFLTVASQVVVRAPSACVAPASAPGVLRPSAALCYCQGSCFRQLPFLSLLMGSFFFFFSLSLLRYNWYTVLCKFKVSRIMICITNTAVKGWFHTNCSQHLFICYRIWIQRNGHMCCLLSFVVWETTSLRLLSFCSNVLRTQWGPA